MSLGAARSRHLRQSRARFTEKGDADGEDPERKEAAEDREVPVVSPEYATLASLDHVTGGQSSAVDRLARQARVKESVNAICILGDNILGATVTQNVKTYFHEVVLT